MYQNLRIHEIIFQPAAVGTDETKQVISVKKGDRVVWAEGQKQILAAAATDTTVTLGDGDDPDGFITAIDTEAGAAGDLVAGAGAYFANSGGKLYTADDTIDVVYDNGTTPGATNPRLKFKICIAHAGIS